MEISDHIVDFQTTHAASISLLAALVIKHGCETSDLARSADDLNLYIRGNREAHQVLRSLGYQILPRSDALIEKIPAFLQAAGLRALLGSKFGQVGVGWHCSQAPDEMKQLAGELEGMVLKSGLPAPSIRNILEFD